MNQYKPEYLGKVIPVDDQDQLTDFVQNRFDSFSKIYDSCKEQSSSISDISMVKSTEANDLSVKISTDDETIQKISEKIIDDDNIKINGDVITAKV
jgi:predicted  nucleic acid-binding Zn-ribbon protein